jgi:hypothetical protein
MALNLSVGWWGSGTDIDETTSQRLKALGRRGATINPCVELDRVFIHMAP